MRKNRTATDIEQTWRFYLHSVVDIPLGDSVIDGLTIAHGEVADLLHLAVQEQQEIGWEKLLLGMGSKVWKTIQEIIDSGNPKPPKRSAAAWMNTAIHQILKFSLRCWKERNNMIHGTQRARERITDLYSNPPTLAPQFRSIFEIPLHHRLKMPLQAAKQWLSLMSQQVKITQDNFKILLRQHSTIKSHLRTMRREARSQAKERAQPMTPRKAHRRAVQAAVKEMRAKLYNFRPKQDPSRCRRWVSKQAKPAQSSSLPSLLTMSFCQAHKPNASIHHRSFCLITSYESSCRWREAQSSMRQTGAWGCVKSFFFFSL